MAGRRKCVGVRRTAHIIADRVQEIRERWNNRLTFPLTKLGERYVRGQLQLRLRGQCGITPFFLSIERRDHEGAQDGEREAECHIPIGHDENEGVVFVFTVKLVENGEWIVRRIRSIVRLEPFENATRIFGQDSLYFSTITGDFVFTPRLLSSSRESDPSLMVKSILVTGEQPSDVIQAGPQVDGRSPRRSLRNEAEFPVWCGTRQAL